MSKTLGRWKSSYSTNCQYHQKRAEVLTVVTFRGHNALMITNTERIPEKMICTEHNTEILIRDYKKWKIFYQKITRLEL